MPPSPPLELWGGVECTINRVGHTFFNQIELSGHHRRLPQDLERFASLGIHTLRTSLLWESFAATHSWQIADRVMQEMQRTALRPIVGLLHHGSGPSGTDLLERQFPEKLAHYALQLARRYPHVLDYTPVNEPQTTGRFACLYGHWYPHHRSMRSYVRALTNQVKAIVLSMRAIRSVQPEARFIHTEDGGETFATPQLESFRVQREHRRWLGVDLLCGFVTRDHALFQFLVENGLTPDEILWFTDNPCPPTILGLNYYVTSDRFLDHRLSLYPPQLPGGDTGTEPLVDIEAVRVRPEGIAGARRMLQQAWSRYRLPMAITEAHLGSDPVQQARWLAEVWRDAQAARSTGADVRAVTVWSLLGAFNWSSLCTRDDAGYEPGVFRLVDDTPHPTPLADLVRDLAQARRTAPDTLRPGWWRRSDRLTIPPPEHHVPSHDAQMTAI